jgi:thioredoxin reductase (NADPH)
MSLAGNDHLESVEWRNKKSGEVERHTITALFSMIGAVPNSAWLEGCVACDGAGFIKTGSDLSVEDLERAHWPLSRLLIYSKPACPVSLLSEMSARAV